MYPGRMNTATSSSVLPVRGPVSLVHMRSFALFPNLLYIFRMQRFITGVLLTFVALVMALDGCVSHDFPEYVCQGPYSFSEDIRPIIEAKCAIPDCHNGDMGSDLNWNDFGEFHERAEKGLVKFRVLRRIMPPSYSPAGPLTQAEVDAIACWTDQGALNN